MICNQRKFKHYSSEKITEVGFCPSVKNQVEAFTQAGRILEGAQERMFHFTDDNLDDNYSPEDIYQDKIESSERAHELAQEYVNLSAVVSAEKELTKQKQSTKVENKDDRVLETSSAQ